MGAGAARRGAQDRRRPRRDLQELSSPATKEYDAVRHVAEWYLDNKKTSLPWRDFQRTFQQFAAKYNALFTGIRKNKPQVELADLQEWLQDHAYEQPEEQPYDIGYGRYQDPETSYRDVEQLVLKINQGASARRVLAEDPWLENYVGMVGQSGEMSGHPTGAETVGWLRVDFIDKDWLLVDEVQSDLVSSVTQAKAILDAETFDDFLSKFDNEKVREKILEKMDPATGRPSRTTWSAPATPTRGWTRARPSWSSCSRTGRSTPSPACWR